LILILHIAINLTLWLTVHVVLGDRLWVRCVFVSVCSVARLPVLVFRFVKNLVGAIEHFPVHVVGVEVEDDLGLSRISTFGLREDLLQLLAVQSAEVALYESVCFEASDYLGISRVP